MTTPFIGLQRPDARSIEIETSAGFPRPACEKVPDHHRRGADPDQPSDLARCTDDARIADTS
ncbi:hypothetical protein AB0I30_27880 [Nocardia tengchongensis]|uniref:hypothetical protein n=1 Tax=Nocardia tengchongensis TaxID=2055889 RepID=UPI00340915C1